MSTAAQTMAVLERIGGPNVTVHPQRCVLVRNRNASCGRCARACTSGAISLNDDGLAIEPQLCIGCGTCASACPTCALEATSPDDQALARATAGVASRTGGTVVLACSHAVSEAADQGLSRDGRIPGWVELACLGRVEPTGLLELAVRGVTRCTLVSGGCAGCEHAAGAAACATAVRDAQALLEACGVRMQLGRLEAGEALAEGLGQLAAPHMDEDAPDMGAAPSQNAPQPGPGAASPNHAAGDRGPIGRKPGLTLAELAGLSATSAQLIEVASDTVARREGFETGRYCEPGDLGGEAAGSGGAVEGDAGEGGEGAPDASPAQAGQTSDGAAEGACAADSPQAGQAPNDTTRGEGPEDPDDVPAAEAPGQLDAPRPAHVGPDGALPQFVPTRRTRLFNCLKELDRRGGGAFGRDSEELETSLWGTVEIDPDLCDGCRMCAVFCPTGALRRTPEGASVFGVLHQPTFCVQCGTCQTTCPKGAITVSGEVPPADFLHGRRHVVAMDEPDWKPNRPDSIYRKIFGMLGTQNNLAVY